MKSVRAQMITWFGMFFWGTTLLMLLVSLGLRMYAMADTRRGLMKRIAKNIIEEIAVSETSSADGDPLIFARIEDQLRLLDSPIERRLTYAVYRSDGTFLYQSPDFGFSIDERYETDEDSKLFLIGVESERSWRDALSVWNFLYRYSRDGYLIFVRSSARFELVEGFAQGMLGAILLAVALAVPSGYFFAKKLVTPLIEIERGVEQVRSGDLAARVKPLAAGDEFARLVEALNATFAELEQSFRHIEQFSANVAHELRTPLTALRGSLEVCLRKARSVAEYQSVLTSAVGEVVMLSDIVEDLLLLSRPRSREAFLLCDLIDFSALVEAVVQAKEIPEHCKLQTDISTQIYVRGDEILLRRACLNLIHNAVKFANPDSPILVSLKVEGDFVAFGVTDHGVGIPLELQQKIFERLYQVDPSRTNGAGLGLTIVKWIVEFHQGHVKLQSEPGVGTLVKIYLPRIADVVA